MRASSKGRLVTPDEYRRAAAWRRGCVLEVAWLILSEVCDTPACYLNTEELDVALSGPSLIRPKDEVAEALDIAAELAERRKM